MISPAVRWLSVVAALSFLAGTAHAQDFPKRPITLIVPFAAGGNSDVIARTVAEQMGTALKQTIVIENIGGAGGSTALTRAARAEPDGYTITIGNAGTNAATYTIYPKSAVHARTRSHRSQWWRRRSASSHCARIFPPAP